MIEQELCKEMATIYVSERLSIYYSLRTHGSMKRKAEFMNHERSFLILGYLYCIWTMISMITLHNFFRAEWTLWDG